MPKYDKKGILPISSFSHGVCSDITIVIVHMKGRIIFVLATPRSNRLSPEIIEGAVDTFTPFMGYVMPISHVPLWKYDNLTDKWSLIAYKMDHPPPIEYYLPQCHPDLTGFFQQQLMQPQLTPRKVYINQNFVPLSSDRTNTVHINPNFKRSVHLNPNFKEPLLQKPNSIYINPLFQPKITNPSISSILKCKRSQSAITNPNSFRNLTVTVDSTNPQNITRFTKINETSVPSKAITNNIFTKNHIVNVSSASKTEIDSKYKIATKNKLIRISSTSVKDSFGNYKLSTRNKLIRVHSPSQLNTSNYNIPLFKTSYSSNENINTKYKIIHNNHNKNKSFNVISDHKIVRKSLQLKKVITKKNKYKIDRRIIDCANSPQSYKISKKASLMNLDPSREIIKRTRREKTKLIKKLPRFIKIKDQIYKFNLNYDTLHFVSSNKHKVNKIKPSKIVIHNYTFLLMPTGVYKRQTVNKMKINLRRLRKDNNPCVQYRQEGFCKNYENGTCLKKHDPKQIRMCRKFLQGACLNDECLLSHKVSPEKMPVCKYFLEGICIKNECSYLHIKLNKNAEICKQFLEGFCSLGLECSKRHQFLCPIFEAKGSCPKRNCKFPHKGASHQITTRKVIDKKETIRKKENKVNKFNKNYRKNKISDLQDEKDDTLRYYERKQDVVEVISEIVPLNKRSKIGDLPQFIAIE